MSWFRQIEPTNWQGYKCYNIRKTMNNKRGSATVLLLRLDPTESICLHDIATYRDKKKTHPPTCRYIMPPWSMLLTNACRHPNRNVFFWRHLQAKRCNNIELVGGQGAGKFLCNECDKLWFTVYRSLPGLDFYSFPCSHLLQIFLA